MIYSRVQLQCNVVLKRFSSTAKVFCQNLVTLNNLLMATSKVKFEILPNPIKSESDKKEYRVIKLENELIACLISDETPLPNDPDDSDEESDTDFESSQGSESESATDESMESSSESVELLKNDEKIAAAALCIGVGSFSDPPDVPGMAHFLEHMVFMGSEKYPAENDFDSFIKKGGGSSNASTDTESTTFYFECLEKYLPEALDRFSQFFISPLMKKGAMTREREAIDSEFQMALPSDLSRREQLLFSLAKPNSPVNSFGWGNLITLKENISDDKLYDGVHKFRKRHYSAHRMTLAIQARLPLDTLENLVIDSFSSIPNNGLKKDDFSEFKNGVFDTPAFNKIYYVKPVKEVIKLDLTWSLPSLLNKYKNKPMQYVSYLLGDEGKGSLLSYLKKKMWAVSVEAGNEESGSEHNSMFALFNVSINLTEEGLKNVYDIVEAVFAYINLIKKVGPDRRIFDEIKLISNTAFRFATEDTPVDNVENLCENMHLYPPEDYMAGPELYYEFDVKTINMVLEYLVPRKLNVMVTTKNLPDGLKFEEREKWFGTEYIDIAIPEAVRVKWESIKAYSDFQLPQINQFLTNDFSILPESTKHPNYPEKIIENEWCELWYRKDQKFKLPMAMYYFYLISGYSLKSARSYVLIDLFMNLLNFAITEEAYPAAVANLSCNFSTIEKGIVIKISGFNEKIPKLIELVCKYMSNLEKYVNKDMFDCVKETLLKNYYNRLLKPSTLSKDLRLKLLVKNHWTPVERYTELLNIQYDDMIQFIQNYHKGLYLKALIQGNVLQEVAIDTVNKFVKELKYEPLLNGQYPLLLVSQIPLGEKCLLVESFNKNDSNCITTNYHQIGMFTLKDSVLIDILILIIEEPFFDILRTKEQLGYHLSCTARETYGILGFSLSINSQSDKFSTLHLDSRIDYFLKHSEKILEEINAENFEEIKEDLIKTKEISDVYLKEEVDRNWYEIVNDDYMFDRTIKEIQTINLVSLEELKIWWEKHNRFGNKENFRKISIQVVGHNTKVKTEVKEITLGEPIKLKILSETDTDTVEKEYMINNIDNFKNKLLLYPLRPIK